MKKEYCVSVDIVMSKDVYVDAESEEQAMAIVREKLDKNPYSIATDFSHMVGYKIIDTNEV